jgi:nitrous oxidase accessory protein NosD
LAFPAHAQTTAATFAATVRAAKPGDTITIAEPFGFNLSGLSFADPGVTVACSPGAVIIPAGSGWSSLSNVQGMTFTGCASRILIGVSGSSRITFDGMDFTGKGAVSGGGTGLSIRDSTDVTVRGSLFHDMQGGISVIRSSRLSIEGNSFRDLCTDAIQIQTQGDVTVKKNFFTLFRCGSLHLDALQIFAADNTQPVRNIRVTDNVYVRGDGATPAQFIFMTDSAMGYVGATVTGNSAYGSAWWGVGLTGAVDSLIADNFLQGSTEAWGGQVITPWIRTDRPGSGLVVRDNAMPAPASISAMTGWLHRNDDPRDVALADLKASMAALRGSLAASEASLAGVVAERDGLASWKARVIEAVQP